MTPQQHTFSLFRLIWPLFLLLAACSPSPDPTPADTNPPTPSAVVMSDCFLSATALAWLDANGDGVRDDGELPLEGIEFVLEPTVYSRTTSGADGLAHITATTPTAGTDTTCDDLLEEFTHQVIVTRFDGYNLTTPGSLLYSSAEVVYAFGFQPLTETFAAATDLLIADEAGYTLRPDWAVAQVNYLFEWYGEAMPVWEYEQIAAANNQFHHSNGTEVTSSVSQLLASLHGLLPVSEVRHTNLWTDDYPEWLVQIVGADGQTILLYSESTGFRGHAPWYVQIGSQLYQQTNGEIGFALYPLVSPTAQTYFSLDEALFDETMLEPGARPSIFSSPVAVMGLLPVARSFTYQLDAAANSLTGSFFWNTGHIEYDTSTHPITGVATIDLLLPGGEKHACTLSNAPDATTPQFIHWSFACPLPAALTVDTLRLQVSFTTRTGELLMAEGTFLPQVQP